MNTDTKNPNRQKLITALTEERDASTAALRRADLPTALAHLERAHILSQSMAGPHVRTHLAMLRFAVSNRRPHEVAGLFLLSVLAAPGTWSGRYPLGSTGGPRRQRLRPHGRSEEHQRALTHNGKMDRQTICFDSATGD